jgi:uncharacterized protein (DUF58 family)
MNEGASINELAPERRLRRLELSVTRRLDGMLQGRYLGLLPGPGSEASGSREYHPGEDEVRRMDWSVTARTTVPHVRTVDADRELATWVLVDGTPSMDFGTAEYEKRELAVAAVAAVGFLTAGAGNRLGAHVLGPDGVQRFPARTGRTHLLGLLRTLLAIPRGAPVTAPVPLADTVEGAHRAVRRRGVVVVVSDFLDGLDDDGLGAAPPDWERPLRRLATRHQVLAVQVTDPREHELPDVGLLTLVDPETGRRREVSTAGRRMRERYAEAARTQQAAIAGAVRRTGANHLLLRTDRDWITDIVRHVQAQRRLTRASRRPISSRGGAA